MSKKLLSLNKIYQIALVFVTVCLLQGVIMSSAYAQDPQYSQYYAAPLYLNPAFAGSAYAPRIGINYRSQWPTLNSNFTTFSAFYDNYYLEKRSGIGVYVMTDREGAAGLRSTTIAGQYSYELQINDDLVVRPGFQASYMRRDVGFYENLIFANQIDPDFPFGPIAPPSENGEGLAANVFSLSVGGLMYTKDLFLGVSAFHLNRPNQSLLDGDSRLPIKISVHGGYKIKLADGPLKNDLSYSFKERSITPTFHYRQQGPFTQLDLGTYFYAEPLVLGVWYRGVPFKPVDSQLNNESIVLLIGMTTKEGLNIGYSFDYTVSRLGIASGGAHEISLSFTLPSRNNGKIDPRSTILPCPKF